MTSINKRNIYGNEYNACALCEYQRELKLIKRLINISEKAVEPKKKASEKSFDFSEANFTFSELPKNVRVGKYYLCFY